MTDCVFCQIANGEVEGHVVYEDEECVAFLDRDPATEGHTLIAPKQHCESLYDVPEEVLAHLVKTAKELAVDYREKLDADGFNLLHATGEEAQQSVFHFHLHLVPRYEGDEVDLWYDTDEESESSFERTVDKLTD